MSEFNQMALTSAAAAAAAATTAMYYSNKTKENLPKLAILVFPDGGEKRSTTGGLAPNAITIRYDRPALEVLEFLKNAVSKELGGETDSTVRLFVQATKKEILDDQELKSILLLKGTEHGLTEIVLISTTDGKELSKQALAGKPLKHFAYTTTVCDLSILGIGHKLAYKGSHKIPMRNAYDNLFVNDNADGDGNLNQKTVLVKRPPYTNDGFYEYYKIDYHPSKQYGVVKTVDPCMVDEMMNRQVDFPKMWTSPPERAIADFGGKGLFTSSSTDTEWETGHGVLPKFFNVFRMKKYFPIILNKTEIFIKEWQKLGTNGVIDDANDWLACMAADAVVKSVMDYDLCNVERKGNNQELHPFIKAFRYCIAHQKGAVPRDQNRYLKEKKICEDMVKEMVEKTRKGEIGGPLSFITGMLEAKASTNGEHVKLADFFGHCMTVMVAGHETTAATLGFLLAELAGSPECMAKAVKEIESVMDDRASPNYEDICRLTYIDACFKEALRMNPPVQSLRRECASDTIVLDNTLLRKGQRIELLTAGLHRDPEQWDQGIYGDVNVFNPDRHLPGAPPRHPNAMVPFGFGVRGCIGMQFAILEAKTFLCMALNFFDIQTPEGFVPTPYIGHGVAPSCLNLSFKLSPRAGGPLSRLELFDDIDFEFDDSDGLGKDDTQKMVDYCSRTSSLA
jgi:cytochrome P450